MRPSDVANCARGETDEEGGKVNRPMLRYILFLVLVLAAGFGLIAACARLFAAQEKAVIDTPRLRAMTAIPLYDPENPNELLQLSVTFTYLVPMLLPDGKRIRPHLKSETADFKLQEGQLVIIGDQLVEFGDLGEDILGVAAFVWRLNNPNQLSPTPAKLERRKKSKVVEVDRSKLLREP